MPKDFKKESVPTSPHSKLSVPRGWGQPGTAGDRQVGTRSGDSDRGVQNSRVQSRFTQIQGGAIAPSNRVQKTSREHWNLKFLTQQQRRNQTELYFYLEFNDRTIAPQHGESDKDHTENSRNLPDTNFSLRKMEARRKLANGRQGASHETEWKSQQYLQQN
jgi:hypothetical protein